MTSIFLVAQLDGFAVRRMAARARKELAKKVGETGIPVKKLADSAGCSDRTVRNFLNGKPVRLETTKRICAAANIEVAEMPTRQASILESSNSLHGSYSKELVQNYLGHFYAYRRSFFEDNIFIKSLYSFDWDESCKCLRFNEFQNYHSKRLQRRVSYDQDGDVFISNAIGLVHLLTITSGALRLVTLTRLHPGEFVMHGAVLTQAEWPDHYQASVSPIFMRKVAELGAETSELMRGLGPVEPADPDHGAIRLGLDYAQTHVVNFRKAS